MSLVTSFTPPPTAAPGVKVGANVDAKIPDVNPELAWQTRRQNYSVVNPANRKRFTIAVVGTGLAGAAASAALGELGYKVETFCFQGSGRRAHSVAAQGGCNSPRSRKLDNDSLYRFVVDTVKGGDFRAREVEAYRLGQEAPRLIDHMNAIGAPFAREYGGTLATRSFGGVQVSRTYYTRGQTGQQLEISAYQAMMRQVQVGSVRIHPNSEMQDLIIEDGVCRGLIVRDLISGKLYAQPAHAVLLCTGGYGGVYYLSTYALGSNVSAAWRAHRLGAYFGMPSLVQFHPTCLPVTSAYQSKTILMSESLRNDARIWVPKKKDDQRPPNEIPIEERDYYLETRYPSYGNLVPRDVASRNGKERVDAGYGIGKFKDSVYLDMTDAVKRLGADVITERYSNLLEVYRNSMFMEPLEVPMQISPNTHYVMGGLWVDYDLMTSIPGLFCGGEANSSYHGANRLGANSLLASSVDGWFVLPLAVPNYLAPKLSEGLPAMTDACVLDAMDRARSRVDALMSIHGHTTSMNIHKRLGSILFEECGLVRSKESLTDGIAKIKALREEFWSDLALTGKSGGVNQALEKAGRVADYLELGELMCVDALDREESCGAQYRIEHTEDGESLRDDEHWQFHTAWESVGPKACDANPDLTFVRHAEPLEFTNVHVARRNYK